MRPLSVEELADQADVEPEYVRQLIDAGALDPPEGDTTYGPSDVGRVRLLRAWEEAGLSADNIMDLVRSGQLSVSWLDTPALTRMRRLDVTYEQFCEEERVAMSMVGDLYEAMGFAPPRPNEPIREGDPHLVDLVRAFLEAGADAAPTLRLVRVYADSMRRIAKAEAEIYETQIEERLRRSGLDERELIDFGARFGAELIADLERAILDVYHRHREHIWIDHSINHAELALERAGLFEKVPKPPSICFVDLTGYTALTEERGDEFAADVAANLASLVEDISRRGGGRPIRWLGDGGMFHFKEPRAAVLAGLEMVEAAPVAELPPMHIGIHTGPVVFQEGDVYGRTVNLASRIASHAAAGQVLASDETARRVSGVGIRFEPLGPIRLKGVARPVELHLAQRSSHRGSS